MEIKFDNTSPIYLQLLNQIKIDIISGKIKSGEKLPSVRELSLIYKVNPNTVQKSLNELENIKLIYTERTNGKFVTEDNNIILKLREEYAKIVTDNYLKNMKNIGYSDKEILETIKIRKEDNK